jgi:hypothetical protein
VLKSARFSVEDTGLLGVWVVTSSGAIIHLRRF